MLTHKKGKPVRLYILESDEAGLDKLCEATGLSGTMVMTLLVSAGIKAAVENGYRIPLPLKFTISEGLPEVAEVRPARITRPR